MLRSPKYTHACRVSWKPPANTVLFWDDVCYQAVELFGLPGDRYITDLCGSHMDWIFRDSKDALLFKLKFAEVVC